MKGMVRELFHFSSLRTLTSLLPLVTSLLGLGLEEWTCPCVLSGALASWIERYNAHDLHSALGYKTPRQFAKAYHISPGTQFVAA